MHKHFFLGCFQLEKKDATGLLFLVQMIFLGLNCGWVRGLLFVMVAVQFINLEPARHLEFPGMCRRCRASLRQQACWGAELARLSQVELPAAASFSGIAESFGLSGAHLSARAPRAAWGARLCYLKLSLLLGAGSG